MKKFTLLFTTTAFLILHAYAQSGDVQQKVSLFVGANMWLQQDNNDLNTGGNETGLAGGLNYSVGFNNLAFLVTFYGTSHSAEDLAGMQTFYADHGQDLTDYACTGYYSSGMLTGLTYLVNPNSGGKIPAFRPFAQAGFVNARVPKILTTFAVGEETYETNADETNSLGFAYNLGLDIGFFEKDALSLDFRLGYLSEMANVPVEITSAGGTPFGITTDLNVFKWDASSPYAAVSVSVAL